MKFLILPLALATGALAGVALDPIFTSDMVLQRGMQVPVWGTATAGGIVTVRINGQVKSRRSGPTLRTSSASAAGRYGSRAEGLSIGLSMRSAYQGK